MLKQIKLCDNVESKITFALKTFYKMCHFFIGLFRVLIEKSLEKLELIFLEVSRAVK